jgi:hypothetical protein
MKRDEEEKMTQEEIYVPAFCPSAVGATGATYEWGSYINCAFFSFDRSIDMAYLER